MELGIIKDLKEINTVIHSLKQILSLDYSSGHEAGQYHLSSPKGSFF